MRPLTLRLNGLRSYLTDQEIDFVDVDLMAIVGDTGAGKSSLLEALCVALYGCCTWDARGAKPLIADGATTLRVELTFRVGEKTWRVTRAISKGPYPPAINLLECLDDGTRIDNGDPVNAAIRRLIGLDFSTFLKAVVLPQGRFQILLQMSNTDRTPILKSILGLDQLIAVREAALELSRRLRPQLAALEQRRAALLPDPQAARRDARRSLKMAKAEVASLDADKKKIAELRAIQGQANARARTAESATERIAAATVADAVEAYGRLMAIESDLSATGNRARNELSALEVDERALQEVLDDADHSGVGIAQLAAAKATITSLIGELPELSAERERCAAEAASIASDRHDLTSRRANVAALEAEARQADMPPSPRTPQPGGRRRASTLHGMAWTALGSPRKPLPRPQGMPKRPPRFLSNERRKRRRRINRHASRNKPTRLPSGVSTRCDARPRRLTLPPPATLATLARSAPGHFPMASSRRNHLVRQRHRVRVPLPRRKRSPERGSPQRHSPTRRTRGLRSRWRWPIRTSSRDGGSRPLNTWITSWVAQT